MKRALLGLLVGCMTLGLGSIAYGGLNEQAGISVFVQKTKPVAKGTDICTTWDTKGTVQGRSCPDVREMTGVGLFTAYVVVCQGSDSLGVGGVEFGLDYDGALGSGIDVFTWAHCADLEFKSGGFPAAGGGNIITWDPGNNCQGGDGADANIVSAVAGVMTIGVYGADIMQVTPRRLPFNPDKAAIADCGAVEDNITDAVPSQLGFATFCSNIKGYSFCAKQTLPVEETTWGRIKNQYKQ